MKETDLGKYTQLSLTSLSPLSLSRLCTEITHMAAALSAGELINPNPVVYEVSESVRRRESNLDDLSRDEIDNVEIFGAISFHNSSFL